jgi:MraZ protein
VFSGRYEHAIDAKGRTSFPSRFREVLAARSGGDVRLMITTALEPCLVAYPMQEWLDFLERLARLPEFDDSVKWLRRIYVSGAMDCEIDKMGRILIPSPLRQHAGLIGEVVWAGLGKKLELWSKTQFDQIRGEILDDPGKRQAMERRLTELGL